MRSGDRDPWQLFTQIRGGLLLVVGVRIRVQEADRDGFDSGVLTGLDDGVEILRSRGVADGAVGATRSRTSKRRRRGTNGSGLWNCRLYISGRLPRPIASASRKPLWLSSAVLTPHVWVMALMTTVVPWTRWAILG